MLRKIVFISLSSLFLLSAVSAFADQSADLRPNWGSAQEDLPANSSFLFSNSDPAFVGHRFGTQVISPRKAAELRQDLENRNRDYEMRSAYGIATQNDERDHNDQMKQVGKNLIFEARNSQTQTFGKNFRRAEDNGEISKPIVIVGGAASVVMGAPVDVKLGEEAKATWHGDLMQKHGQIDVVSKDVSATVEMSGKSDVPEHYIVSVSKPLPLNVGSSVVYGGTSNTVTASLSRQVINRVTASVGASYPAGTSPTGAPPQATAGLNYGLNF